MLYLPIDKDSMESKPFIHLFKSSSAYYVYDVNTNQIITVSKDIYNFLSGKVEDNTEGQNASIIDSINEIRIQGFLKSNHAKVTEHPLTELYEDYLCNKISHLTLQVTQMCNLRCEYCTYSGGYNNRSHSDKRMSTEIAQKAIDYLIKHSRDSVDRFGLSFFGGEPLLAFDLIKMCVHYIKERAEGRTVKFNFTTNGTLLTEEKIEFLMENDFNILVSLDGPDYIHNKNRKFANSEKGSFDILIKNLDMIKNKYPEFYKNNISFNTVLDPTNEFTCVNNFIINSEMFDKTRFSSSVINDTYAKNPIVYSSNFEEEYEYELFKLYLSKLGWLSEQEISPMLNGSFSRIKRTARSLESHKLTQMPEASHRGGPCLPGVHKLFVDVNGEFYPCERVSESSSVTKIGNIDSGIDLDKATRLLNIEQFTSDLCKNCWGYYYCTTCIARADDGTKISKDMIESACKGVRKNIESDFLDYCVLKELGYDIELDE